jgi:hypothetical protein
MDRFRMNVSPWLCLAASTLPFFSAIVEAEELLPPSHIKLKAGILHAPPFAVVDHDQDDGSLSFSGFQLDLLNSLQEFALQDNVTLEFELSLSPAHYGEALDSVATDCMEKLGENNAKCSQFDLIIGDYYGCVPWFWNQRGYRLD